MKNELSLHKLADQWQRDSDQYQSQVTEAMAKLLPFEQMAATATTLKLCASQLRRVIEG